MLFKLTKSKVETIKAILLVVLFLMTILLLYFFWKNDSFQTFRFPLESKRAGIVSTLTVDDVTHPSEIAVSFGSTGTSTVLSMGNQNLWKTAILEFKKIGDAENIVEEITAEQYEKIMEYESIQFKFQYDVPLNDFCTHYEIKKSQSMDLISGVGTVGYSAGSKDSLFIYQNKGKKYYRLISSKKVSDVFLNMIRGISETSYVTYYPSSIYFGVEGKNNNTLIPLSLVTNLQKFPYQAETHTDNQEKIRSVAESFFGESFDFIRKISDSQGMLIYMYGYGQKVLNINANGVFEYKEQAGSAESTPLDFYASLETALNFVSAHGSWESLDGARLTPYLESVYPMDQDKQKGYSFRFGMLLEGNPIYYEDGVPIQVDVLGSQVVYYRRSLIDFEEKDRAALQEKPYGAAFEAVNVPAINFQYLKELVLKVSKEKEKAQSKDAKEIKPVAVAANTQGKPVATPAPEPEENKQPNTFEEVAAEITAIEAGYVRPASEEAPYFLMPAWIVKTKEFYAYFDLYTAEPMGYYIMDK